MDNTNNEVKDSFEQLAATMAHEIKNPLALIKANVDLLEFDDKSEFHKKSFEVMRREISKINEMILDFINNVRDDSFEKINIGHLLRDVTEEFKTLAKIKEITVIEKIENKKLTILGAEEKIRRVLLNILKNAYDAVSEGGTIEVTAYEFIDYIKIEIKDDGIGMNEEILKMAGSPFFTTKEGGSGLGISICKKIIEEHGGIFNITGKPNEGCSVVLLIKKSRIES